MKLGLFVMALQDPQRDYTRLFQEGREAPPFLQRFICLITGDPITDDLIVQLVDEVLVPFVAPRN